LNGLAGGILIGIASLLATVATGKIPGISGILSHALRTRSGSAAWTIVFLQGLIAGAAIIFAFIPTLSTYRPVQPLPTLAVAGLLVGLGTRIGGGCTSGHGICGIGLGIKSSLVATVIFMGAGMAAVFVSSHLFGGTP
jgi:uncharacterized membrane protein YedE/YeeE